MVSFGRFGKVTEPRAPAIMQMVRVVIIPYHGVVLPVILPAVKGIVPDRHLTKSAITWEHIQTEVEVPLAGMAGQGTLIMNTM